MSRLVELFVVIIIILLCFLMLTLILKKYPDIFYRDKPLGLCQAHLDDKPHWVSSLVEPSNEHYVSPLPVSTFASMANAMELIDPNTYILIHPFYMEGYRRTAYFGFTDWFCINELGHVTSTATLGYSDLGNNKRWVEQLRLLLERKENV